MSQDDMLERELAKLANNENKPTQVEEDLISEELAKVGANYDGAGGAIIWLTAKLLPDDVGQVTEGSQNTHKTTVFIGHAPDGHLDAPGLAPSGNDIQRIGQMLQ